MDVVMNEIVYIPATPPPPRISQFEIATTSNSKSNKFNFQEMLEQDVAHMSFENSNGVFVQNFINLDDAMKIFEFPWLIDKINNSLDFLLIKVGVEGSIDSLDVSTVSKFINIIDKKFSVILFQTFFGKCQIFWKFEGKSFWLKVDSQASIFVSDFLASSLINNHPGILYDILSIVNSTNQIIELDLLSLCDVRNYNLLMLAAEAGDASVVDSFIQHGFDVNVMVADQTAVALAYDNHHYDIVLALMHANSLYPRKLNNSHLTDELKKFIDISHEIHNNIRHGNLEKVEEIVDDNPNLRHFYNIENVSAASQAVKSKQFDIYKFLLSRNVYIGPKEDFNAILQKVNNRSKESMRGIHLDYIQSSSDNHLMILTVNSFVGHDVPNADEKLKHITKAFKFLNDLDPLLSLILKVVAASRDFKIIFDFHRPSIQHLDPTSSQFTRGVYHTSRHIYIAAQSMLNPDTIHEIYGTMAHELCHYALNLVYHNDCRPYSAEDLEMITYFTKIALRCEMWKEKEYLISCVFTHGLYPKEFQHAELIVRVPHMIAEYSKNPEKLQENRQTFLELFQFAENVMAVDMENSLEDIKIHAEDEIKKFAYQVKKQERENFWLWIFSIFCILTLPLMVYVTLWMSDTSKPVYGCGNLTNQRYKILESTVNFQGVPVIFQDLFGNGTDSCMNLTANEIGKMLDVYDANQFIDPEDNIYKNVTDRNIIQNEQEMANKNDILESYKNTSFRQPSLEVSSKVDLKASFYIGRRVYQKLSKGITRNVFSFDELKNNKIVFFSDSAGNGKSTTFRYAAWKLKRSLPLHWVSFVELKEKVEELKTIDVVSMNKSEVAEFMSVKILNLTSNVDRSIFNQKFEANSTIILWDGVDEISPICTDNILGLIEKVKVLTENKQWISTRVHLEDKISSRFKVKAYGLSYYNETERINFIRKFLEINNINEESARIIEGNINSTISNLENPGTSKRYENKELNTPLMVRMICERQLNKFIKESDKNITINPLDKENTYTFYEHFIDQHIGIANNTKSIVVSTDVMEVNKRVETKEIHQYHALKEIFGAVELKDIVSEAGIDFKDLEIINSTYYATNEQLTRFGILYENSAGQLKFEHRTFAEFFVAQYFFDHLWDINSNYLDLTEVKIRLQLFLFTIKNDEQFKVILDFIGGFLEIKKSKSPFTFGNKVRKVIDENYSQLFHYLDNKASLIDLTTKFFKKDKEIVTKLWKINENFTFFQENFNFFSDMTFYNELREVVINNFDEEDQRKILNGNNQGIYILFRIWSKQYNFTDYINTIPNIEVINKNLTKINEVDIVEFLKYVDTLNYTKSDFREFFRQTLIENFQLLSQDVEDFRNFWKFIEKKLDNNDIKQILFNKQIINDQTILFLIRHLKHEFIQIIFEFLENHLNESDVVNLMVQRERFEGTTFVSYDIESIGDLKALNLTWKFVKNHTTADQQREILSPIDKTIKAVWMLKSAEIFETFLQIFVELFTKPELCNQVVDLIENMEIYAINSEEHGQVDSTVTIKKREFLEDVCQGDEKILGNIYSGIIDIYIK